MSKRLPIGKDGVVFSQLEKSPEAIWSLLLFSVYLTIDNIPSYGTPIKLRIPNRLNLT
jgi:hypothetical protein